MYLNHPITRWMKSLTNQIKSSVTGVNIESPNTAAMYGSVKQCIMMIANSPA